MIDKKVQKEHAKLGAARNGSSQFSLQASLSSVQDKPLVVIAAILLLFAGMYVFQPAQQDDTISGFTVADMECQCDGNGCTGAYLLPVGEFLVAQKITDDTAKKNACSTSAPQGGAPGSLNILLAGERCIFDPADPKQIEFTYNGGKKKTFRSYCIDDNYNVVAQSNKRGFATCDDKDLLIQEQGCPCSNGGCAEGVPVQEPPEPVVEPQVVVPAADQVPQAAPQQPEEQAAPPQPPLVAAAVVDVASIDKCYDESDCFGGKICRWPLNSKGAKKDQFQLDKPQVCASKISNNQACVRDTQCSSGFCYLGQCKQKDNCKDEDAGQGNKNKQALVSSVVFERGRAYSDMCTPSNGKPELLTEGICKGGSRDRNEVDCASLGGKICLNGACVAPGKDKKRNGNAKTTVVDHQATYECDEGFAMGSGAGKPLRCFVQSNGGRGAVCNDDSECQSGSCSDKNMYGIGKCMASGYLKLLGNNKLCETSAQCEPNYYCKENNRGEMKCGSREREGKECTTHRMCQSNLCTNGKCAAKALDGEGCFTSWQCKRRSNSDIRCVDGICTSPNAPAAPAPQAAPVQPQAQAAQHAPPQPAKAQVGGKKEKEKCSSTAECSQNPAKLVCRRGYNKGKWIKSKKTTCRKPVGNKGPCVSSDQCALGLYCPAATKKCTVKKIKGAACKLAEECTAGCENGKCKVICTELNRQGYMPDSHYKASKDFADQNLDDYNMIGYHYWAKPSVRLMQGSKELTDYVKPVGLAWGRHVAHQMGVTKEADPVGAVVLELGEAYSRELGIWLVKNGLAKTRISDEAMEVIARKHLPGLLEGTDKEAIARLKKQMPLFFGEIRQYAQEQQIK